MNFSHWLSHTMKANHIHQKDIAELLLLSQQAVSYKIRQNTFTLVEVCLIFSHYPPTKEELLQLFPYHIS